jgi:hypothetical protein
MTRIYALTFLLYSACFALSASAQGDGAKFTSFAGFELGKVTLGQIAESLGPAKLLESGDAGEYEAKICYRTNTGLVYFLSGEMGGQNHDLLGFAVSRNDATTKCPEFPSKRAPKKLNLAGLRLGLTKTEFSRIVATKIQWEDNVSRAFFESKRTMSSAEIDNLPQEVKIATLAGKMQNYFDVVVSVIGTFSGDKLIEFRVWKVETL